MEWVCGNVLGRGGMILHTMCVMRQARAPQFRFGKMYGAGTNL